MPDTLSFEGGSKSRIRERLRARPGQAGFLGQGSKTSTLVGLSSLCLPVEQRCSKGFHFVVPRNMAVAPLVQGGVDSTHSLARWCPVNITRAGKVSLFGVGTENIGGVAKVNFAGSRNYHTCDRTMLLRIAPGNFMQSHNIPRPSPILTPFLRSTVKRLAVTLWAIL